MIIVESLDLKDKEVERNPKPTTASKIEELRLFGELNP